MSQKFLNGLSIILIIAFLFLIVRNIIVHSSSFLDASLVQVLTLMVALFITFWANQYKNDQRKAKEHAESLIMKLQQIVTDESFYCISVDGNIEETKREINSKNRKISNYIRILTEYGKTLKFSDKINYISEQFSQYKSTTGDHIAYLEYLSKTETTFHKISENIDSKCEDIILLLYK